MKYSVKELIYFLFHRLPAIIKGRYLYHNLIKVHWGRGMNNFGDCLSPDILKHYGLTPVYVPNQMEADIILAGSILQWVNPEYNGIIIGTGGSDILYALNNATVLAVRGKLTHKNFRNHKNFSNIIYGDPGLLMSNVYSQPLEKKYELGIIPHFVDWNSKCVNNWRASFHGNPNVIFISPLGSPKKIIKKIKKCKHIVSSSLHGLIIADSFHIPNMRFVNRATMPTDSYNYKYDDYYSSINEDSTFFDAIGNETLEELIAYTNLKDVEQIELLKRELDKVMISVLEGFKLVKKKN